MAILCNASSMSLPQRIELVQQEDSAAVCEKTQLLAHVLTLCGAHTLTGRDVLTGKSTLNDKDVSQLNFDRRELQITSVGREWQIMDSMSFHTPKDILGMSV